MRIIARKALREFWEVPKYVDAEEPLKTWYELVSKADWKTPADVKDTFRSASFVRNNRVVFNIGGNKYRLVGHIRYNLRRVYVRFVGTHAQYDKIDVNEV